MTLEAPAIDRDSVVVREQHLPSSRIDEEIVILNVATGRYNGLDEIGRHIWESIDSPIRVSDLCDGLAARYRGDAEVMERDTIHFLNQLLHESLIRVES